MPNLQQLIRLKTKYPSEASKLKPTQLKRIVESFDPNRIEKSFSFDPQAQKYIDHFKLRKKEKVVLLFIDVASFSSRFQSLSSEKIVEYLDGYYKRVIPIIHEFGGEVEKIMGDGIICVFGQPFLEENVDSLHRKAEKCSMKIIRDLQGTNYESKIAFHFGEVMYYQNESESYHEFTMIGSALTDLFRLESVSSVNCINFYCGTEYEKMNVTDVNKPTTSSTPAPWTLGAPESIDLKGVTFSKMRRLEKI